MSDPKISNMMAVLRRERIRTELKQVPERRTCRVLFFHQGYLDKMISCGLRHATRVEDFSRGK